MARESWRGGAFCIHESDFLSDDEMAEICDEVADEARYYDRRMRAVDAAAALGRWSDAQRIAARIVAARQIESGHASPVASDAGKASQTRSFVKPEPAGLLRDGVLA